MSELTSRGGDRSLPVPSLMLVTEPSPRLGEIVEAAVSGGVNVVQFRCKTAEFEEWHEMAGIVYHAVRGRCPVIVNGLRWATEFLNVAGVHLPESESGAMPSVGELIAPELLLGRSAHSVGGAIEAANYGADYLVFGNVFETSSHPGAEAKGTVELARACASVTVPVLAIGGVTVDRVAECVNASASGIAVLSAIIQADDPQSVARDYWTALDSAWKARR